MKRFQVSDRFAGQKGPCPNCKTIIEIPKAAVVIHGIEPASPYSGGNLRTKRIPIKPLERIVDDFDVKHAAVYAASAFGVFLAAVIVGLLSLSVGTRSVLGLFGLLVSVYPLSLFGYQVLRDHEQLFIYTGVDLHRRTGLTALGYVILWIIFEYFLQYTNAFGAVSVLYFAAFAVFGMFLALLVLEIPLGNALMHFLIFAVPIILLRYLSGLDWIWVIHKVDAVPLPSIW
jgi:hypothetical protein